MQHLQFKGCERESENLASVQEKLLYLLKSRKTMKAHEQSSRNVGLD